MMPPNNEEMSMENKFIDGDIVTGDFTIIDVGGGDIYISHISGEGGSFKKDALEGVVSKFFYDNF